MRVAARNSVSQLSTTTDAENDPSRWSEVVSAVAANNAPSSPVLVTSAVSGPTSLHILISHPMSDGGVNITFYLIEWDASKQLDDTSSSLGLLVLPAAGSLGVGSASAW